MRQPSFTLQSIGGGAAHPSSDLPSKIGFAFFEIQTPYGLRTCFEARAERQGRKPLVARFGGISLKRNRNMVVHDRIPDPAPHRHREVVQRLLRGACEICKQTDNIEIHQIRKLADLVGTGATGRPEWMTIMARKRRKTLVLCGTCHDSIHPGATPA